MRNYKRSSLYQRMKTNLIKEWLETKRINQRLLSLNQKLILLEEVPVLDSLDPIVEQISRDTIMDYREPDTKVTRQGYRNTDSMFVISQGSCQVSIYDTSLSTGKLKVINVAVLQQNDYFGEISLIFDSVRTATVTCKNYCTLGRLSIKTLFEVCENQSFVRKALLKRVHLYNDQLSIFVMETLREVPYLACAKQKTLSSIAKTMKQDYLEPGAVFCDSGEKQGCLSII